MAALKREQGVEIQPAPEAQMMSTIYTSKVSINRGVGICFRGGGGSNDEHGLTPRMCIHICIHICVYIVHLRPKHVEGVGDLCERKRYDVRHILSHGIIHRKIVR